jgi:hypothetical protein
MAACRSLPIFWGDYVEAWQQKDLQRGQSIAQLSDDACPIESELEHVSQNPQFTEQRLSNFSCEPDDQTSRLFRHNLTALRDVDRRAIHARGFARSLRRPAERPSYSGGEAFRPFYACSGFHFFRSSSTGEFPELSYTAQDSEIGR